MPAVHTVLRLVVPIKEREVQPVLLSFGALFSILFSYFLLLPLREDAGISLGTSTLPLLFACSLLVTLIVTPTVTAYLNSKGHAQGRDAALRHFYRVMSAILLGFFVCYNFSMVESWMDRYSLSAAQHGAHLQGPAAAAQHSGSSQQPASHHPLDLMLHQRQQQQQQQQQQNHQQQQQSWRHMRHLLQADEGQDSQDIAASAADSIQPASTHSSTEGGRSSHSSGSGSGRSSTVSGRTGDATLSKQQRLLRAAFYVWIGVMNLVGISSLWAKCADTFDPESAKRLFGFISAGATLGQLAGSLTAMLASWLAGKMLSQVHAGMSSGGSDAGASSKAAPPASSLLLVAAVLQLTAAQLVTRIRPVAGTVAAAANPCVIVAKVVTTADNNSNTAASGTRSSRPASPLLTRRSFSGNSRGRATLSTIVQEQQPPCDARPDAAAAPLLAGSDSQNGAAGLLAPAHNGAPGGNCGSDPRPAAGADAAATVSGSSDGPVGSKQQQQGPAGSKGAADSFQMQKVLTGFQLIWRSPYLLLVCSNLLLTYVVGSLMYFQRALVVSAAAAVHGPTFRTAFFAALNTWSAAAILLMQLFATSSMLRLLGMTAALGLAPAICLTGLFSVASCPLPWMVAVSEVLRKLFGYAVLRPAREVLFTVVSREEKYSAKLVIDTVIQRLGDALAAAVFQVLDVQYSLGQQGVAAAGCVACVLWLVTALALGRKHKQLASHGTALKV